MNSLNCVARSKTWNALCAPIGQPYKHNVQKYMLCTCMATGIAHACIRASTLRSAVSVGHSMHFGPHQMLSMSAGVQDSEDATEYLTPGVIDCMWALLTPEARLTILSVCCEATSVDPGAAYQYGPGREDEEPPSPAAYTDWESETSRKVCPPYCTPRIPTLLPRNSSLPW